MADKWIETTCKQAWMQWKFKEEHIALEFHGIKVTGRPDGKLIVVNGRLLEIKSLEEEKFNDLTEPRDYHVFQASVYGAELGFDEVVIFYVNWNHWWQVKAFVVPVDKGAMKMIANTCETIRFLLDHEDPMRALPVCKKRSAWKARECGCKDLCFPLKRKRKSGK
jgi:hypothetical protein